MNRNPTQANIVQAPLAQFARIGGTGLSLVANPGVQSAYRNSQKNWAFYFYNWSEKGKGKDDRES